MDTIIRGTTPTITLTVVDDVPEGAVSSVTVTQGESSFNPDVSFDIQTKSVSFRLSKLYTEAFIPDKEISVQQTLTFANGVVETLQEHYIMIKDMLYIEPPEPETPQTDMIEYETEDVVVDPDMTYFEYSYVKAVPIASSSPIDMDLYEFDSEYEDGYFKSQDTKFEEKEYYMRIVSPVTPDGTENPSELGWLVLVSLDEDEESSDEEAPTRSLNRSLENDSEYVPVVPEGNENPKEMGWLVINDLGFFVLTTDVEVDGETQYYEGIDEDYMDEVDLLYSDFDEESFAAYNNLTCVDDEEPETYSDYVYSPVVNGVETDNPNQNGWYEKSEDSYVLSQDIEFISAKIYYKLIENKEWVVDDDSTGGIIPEEY